MKTSSVLFTPKKITLCAMFMAINIAVSSVGIPVPGGSFYLCDIIICTAAILLDPISAFLVGGFGAFMGDLFFYPTAMVVSLVVHGLQAFVISFCANGFRLGQATTRRFAASVVGVSLGTVIMVVGYTIGAAFVYSSPEYALLNIPYELLQSGLGAVASILLCYKFGLIGLYDRMMRSSQA